jgi:glycosyltransferase involved in cell wall biosynthesis
MMRAAVFCTCPQGVYSGGRYHAFMLAVCLARLGHDTYFVSNETPIFAAELENLYPEGRLQIVNTKNFFLRPTRRFDFVAVAPQITPLRNMYEGAIRFARESGARLALINFESANWYNSLSPSPRPKDGWAEWSLLTTEGCLVLCSAEENLRHARDFYKPLAPDTRYDIWQPAINDLAIPPEPEARENAIVVFARPMDKHKGGGDVEALLRPELAGYALDIVIGNPKGAEPFVQDLSRKAEEVGMTVRGRFGLCDVDKFKLIRSAKALVFPSYFEGYGYPPIEALACDTPCVAYDLPVVRENCGDVASLVPIGDVESLFRSLEHVVRTAPGPQPTSDLPSVRKLASVAERTLALGEVLDTDRRECRTLHNKLGRTADGTIVSATAGSAFQVHGRTVLAVQIEVRGHLVHASGPPAIFDRVELLRGRRGVKAVRHTLALRLHSGGAGALEAACRAEICLTYENGTTILLPLADLQFDEKPAKLPRALASMTRRVTHRDCVVLDGWLYPETPYDGLILMSDQGDVSAADIGINDLKYAGSFPRSPGLRCGFRAVLPLDAGDRRYVALTMLGGRIAGHLDLGPLGAVPASRTDGTALPLADDSPAFFAGPDGPDGKRVFASTATRVDDLVSFRGWSNVADEPVSVNLYSHADASAPSVRRRLAQTSLHVIRPDIETKYSLGSIPPVGFDTGVFVAPNDGIAYSAELVSSEGTVIDVASFARLGTGNYDNVRRATVSPLSHARVGEPSLIVARPTAENKDFEEEHLKWACSACQYNLKTGKLFVRGWVLAKTEMRIEILSDPGGVLLGTAQTGFPRPDVASRYGIADAKAPFGFEFDFQVPLERLGEIAIRVFLPSGPIHRRSAGRPVVTSPETFQVTDAEYDPVWRKLWLRGLFAHPGLRPTALSVMRAGTKVASGVAPVKRQRGTEMYAGWVVEAILDRGLAANEELTVVVDTDRGLSITLATSIARFPKMVGGTLTSQRQTLALARDGVNAVRNLVAPFEDGRRTALLVVHNLDAPDRPQKLRALQALGHALEERGAKLICFHHSKGSVADTVNEIRFFDPVLDDVAQRSPTVNWPREFGSDRKALGRLDLILRTSYGFYASRDRNPVPWAECDRRIGEEYQKLKAVIEAVRPQVVLLWHQWNSLCEVAELIASRNRIPTAFVHEGMLPLTMTIDPAGMMAEASCAGAVLRGSGPIPQQARAKAAHIIRRIADERLDRKPQLAVNVVAPIVQALRERGSKVLFYAGVNDWQSGNLPLDAPKARQHSPHYADTLDGLIAIAAVAAELDAFVLFKPHPNLYPRETGVALDRVIMVRDANTIDLITETDATATLLSSVAYVSLAHRRPTVLLGRNSLSGTGAAYELAQPAQLKGILRDAFEAKDLGRRLAAFESHVGALVKDFLFPYGEGTDHLLKDYGDAADLVLSLSSRPGPLRSGRRKVTGTAESGRALGREGAIRSLLTWRSQRGHTS